VIVDPITGHKLHNAVRLYIDGVRDGHLFAALEKYVDAQLIQHSPGITQGRAGLLAFYRPLVARYDRRIIRPLRGFEDSGKVFLHSFRSYGYRNLEQVSIDIFDTNDDHHLVEHWSVTTPLLPASATGRSQLDGPTYVEDLAATSDNKKLIDAYLTEVLIDGHRANAGRYVCPAYIEHGPAAGAELTSHRAGHHRPNRDLPSMTYLNVIQIVGRGNFVAALSAAVVAGERHLVADLYRLQRHLIVEHWNAFQAA
jgi:predicted SnoaL-like aldol condensation-catalyzing enzyme